MKGWWLMSGDETPTVEDTQLDDLDDERDAVPLDRPSIYCDKHPAALARKYLADGRRRLCLECCAEEGIPLYGVKVTK